MTDLPAEDRVSDLEQRLANALARLPKHSTPMAMMMEIEELEDALAKARADTQRQADATSQR